LDPSNLTLPQSALLTLFQTASYYPNYLGLSALAEYDQDGNQSPNVLFPFRLVFHPFTNLHEMFPSDPQDGAYYFLSQLESVPIGPLFQVYAQQTPSSDLEMIGTINTLGNLSGSQYGDLNLFFEHTRMESDFVYHPEWIGPAEALQEEQANIPYYTWPDLPWN